MRLVGDIALGLALVALWFWATGPEKSPNFRVHEAFLALHCP